MAFVVTAAFPHVAAPGAMKIMRTKNFLEN